MKRFHVHVAVQDLPANITFYSRLFGAEPSVTRPDYAKWMLDDPRINFAISTRARRTGIEHLGLQVDSDEELDALRDSFVAGGAEVTQQKAASCCYARSDKYWATDPQGVPWEAFHTLAEARLFGDDTGPAGAAAGEPRRKSTCCAA